MSRHFILLFVILIILLLLLSAVSTPAESLKDFMARLQESFNTRNMESYLQAFAPEIRSRERENAESMYDDFKMERISFHAVRKEEEKRGKVRANYQVVYDNDYSAFIELWRISFLRQEETWKIVEKETLGNMSILYKIEIPSERIERVKSVRVEYVDISLYFEDAIIFYDNIPGLETALLITGKGSLSFFPSQPEEQHQLQLIYKTDVLEDTLDYVYLRFSEEFFENNVKIEREAPARKKPVTQAEINRAYSLFQRHYPRSFTIESSLDGGLLSFLPQGGQVVFDFEGRKTGLMTYIYSPFSRDEVTLFDAGKERLINLYSPSFPEEGKKLFVSFAQKYDIEKYSIDIDFNPRQSFLSGRARIRVKSEVSSLSSLKFKFNSKLKILRIFDEQRNELFYTQDRMRNIIYIYLVQPINQSESAMIEVYYRGKLELPQQVADVIPAPQVGLDQEIIVPPRFFSHLFTQSAYWYPSPPDVDYFQARVRIIVPPSYLCIANGELRKSGMLEDLRGIEEVEKLGYFFYVFETVHPVKYLSFIVGKFTKVEEDKGYIPVEVYVSSNMRYYERDVLEDALEILEFYESHFGNFPYEKLSIVQRLWPLSGGHSPASFIVINRPPQQGMNRIYRNPASPVDLSRWREYFLAHEIAHQWWGQGVTWASYRDQWLSEGLAQYSAVLYLSEKRGERTLNQILRKFSNWTEKKTQWGPVSMGSRLSYFDFDAFQTIIYNKTSLVLNMLREILGDELFFKGTSNFFAAHKYSKATTADFIRSMEKVSGRSLKPFFESWFETHLLPEVSVEHSVEKKGDSFELILRINQLRGNFVFPLWIEWRENGKKVRKKIVVSQKKGIFSFTATVKPSRIRVNPEHTVPGGFF
ncbi:MAG: M1 family metallopeptidase [Candidatus Aminicenantales bacterium]